MKQIFLFNELSRAAVYGIGTYVRQVDELLKCQKEFSCSIVNINCDRNDILLDKQDNTTMYYIPKMQEECNRDRYYRNIFFLLQPSIGPVNNNDELIFHFNFFQEKCLIKELREYYPKCKILFSIHYFNWCFALKGNRLHFRNIIENEQKNSTDKIETQILEDIKEVKEVISLSDRVICLSESTENMLIEDYNITSDKLTTVYNGLTDEAISLTQKEKAALKAAHHIKRNEKIILFAGRVDEVKGIKYIIRAFRKVLETIPNCRLLIAGNGDFQPCMEECETVWTNVTFTGLINKAHLYELYTLADIGVMMSFHEQCSYVAIEMMMHGLPLIGTTSTGLNEMIEEGVSGLHVPVEEYPDKVEIDMALLAEKMLSLLQNPQARKRMGRNARKRYETLYTSELMGERMYRLYQSLTEKPH